MVEGDVITHPQDKAPGLSVDDIEACRVFLIERHRVPGGLAKGQIDASRRLRKRLDWPLFVDTGDEGCAVTLWELVTPWSDRQHTMIADVPIMGPNRPPHDEGMGVRQIYCSNGCAPGVPNEPP